MQTGNNKVLITGAGPTGLTLANLFSKMDIPFLLIDKLPHPSRDSKAFGIHARTLEIFDQLGIADRAIREGDIDTTVHLVVKGKEAAKIKLGNILPGESAYPRLLILQQDKTEKLLIDLLKEPGHSVLWEHELTHLKENKSEKKVSATIQSPSGSVKENFEYVIGCDGAGSTVRKLSGFSFEGKTYSPTFYLADCEINEHLTHGDVYFIFSPLHMTGVFSFPEENRFRIFNFMNQSVRKSEDDELSPDDVQNILDDNPYLRLKAENIDWTSIFRIHSRYTGSFQKGRVLLAGDAAHVHSPAGGQGMNTGIQDAYNIAWKLNLVLKGVAGPDLLRSYHEERFPIAKNLHNTTDRLFQLMTRQSRWMDLFRFYVAPCLFRTVFGTKRLRKRNLRRFSQLAIKYRGSSLSRTGSEDEFLRQAPEPGDRAPYCKILMNGDVTGIYRLFNCTHFTILIAASSPGNKQAKNLQEELNNMSRLPVTVHMLDKETYGKVFF